MDIKPIVNGDLFSHCSLEVKVAGETIFTAQEVSYKATVERATVHATGPEPVGRTSGQKSYEASLGILLSERKRFIDALKRAKPGKPFMHVQFDVIAQFSEDGMDAVTDSIRYCKLKDSGVESQQGNEPTKCTFALDVLRIDFDGNSPYAGDQ